MKRRSVIVGAAAWSVVSPLLPIATVRPEASNSHVTVHSVPAQSPMSWHFNQMQSALSRRHLLDLAIPLNRIDFAFGADRPISHVADSAMELTVDNGRATLANAAQDVGEASLFAFPLDAPFVTIEMDVDVQSNGNAIIELRNENANRVLFVARPGGANSGIDIVTEGQSRAVDSVPTPTAPYRMVMQVCGTSVVTGFIKNNEWTFAGRSDLDAGLDFRKPEALRGWGVYFTSRGQLSEVAISRIEAKLAGIGHADPRVVSYEDGTPIIDDDGYIHLLMTTRGSVIANAFQGVYRVNPVTGHIAMTGAVFTNRGDGVVRNDNAGHLFFDRLAQTWRLIQIGHSDFPAARRVWVASFTQDIRDDISTIDVTEAVFGDGAGAALYEDVYTIWDPGLSRWVATASKHASISARLEAKNFDGPYREVATAGSHETGNLLIKSGGRFYVLAGTATEAFIIRNYEDLTALGHVSVDIGTGGDRVWPVIFPYRDTMYMFSFDRHTITGPDRYSYGRLYLYELAKR